MIFGLNKKDCDLQIGGSDQQNIVNGVKLIKRFSKNKLWIDHSSYHISNRCKMGKTESGVAWLDRKLFSI